MSGFYVYESTIDPPPDPALQQQGALKWIYELTNIAIFNPRTPSPPKNPAKPATKLYKIRVIPSGFRGFFEGEGVQGLKMAILVNL